jgi:GWxTD domain-containing protein
MRFAVFMIVFCLTAPSLRAQFNGEQPQERSQNPLVTYQALSKFRADSGLPRVDIHYRIGESYFIFVRNESPNAKSPYIARGELSVELLNDQRVSVAREIRQLQVLRNQLLRDSERAPSLQGAVSLTAPPGTYTVVFSVDDRESGRTFMERTRKITLPAIAPTSLETSSIMFVQETATPQGTVTFVPTNRGGNTLFAESGYALIELHQPTPDNNLAVEWSLSCNAEVFGQKTVNIKGSEFRTVSGLVRIVPQETGITYVAEQASPEWKTLLIPLPLAQLTPGRITLEIQITSGPLKKNQTHQFSVIWPSRPLSLADADLAIDALRHIAPEEEIEKMTSGPIGQRSEAFISFWRAKSPDTLTAYNVQMAEYYYRVDEATRKYSTIRENDGYKTDRGRIYILYGQPQRSERLLQPNSSPMEIWSYDRLGKRFVFIDTAKNGNYILTQVENL